MFTSIITYYLLHTFAALAIGYFIGFATGKFNERAKQNQRLGSFASDVHTRVFTGRWPR